MNAVLDVKGLHQYVRVGFLNRRVDVLHGVDLEVPRGSVFGLVGQNGAGKSTTIKAAIGVLTPHEGSVRLFGRDPKEKDARSPLGYLPEVLQLPPTLTPDEILNLHGGLCGLDRVVLKRRADALLDRVRLTGRRGDLVRTFSKGMAQRLALAVALLSEPDLLILDEPMSGLDPMGRALVREIILDERRAGRTVFFSSHVLPDVQALCDRVAVMHGGRVVRTGTLEELFVGREHLYEIEIRKTDALSAVDLKIHGDVDDRADVVVLTLSPGTAPMEVATTLGKSGVEVLEVRRATAELESVLVDLVADLEGDT